MGYKVSFNFHDMITLSINTKRKNYKTYLENEFMPCLCTDENVDNSDIVVNIDKSEANLGGLAFNHKFRQFFRAKYSITKLSGTNTIINFLSDWSINFYTPVMGTFLQTSVIEPIMYRKLLDKRCLLAHSSAVAYKGKATLFIATGGSGKTTTALRFANKGMSILGDDLIFLTQDGYALPYPRPLHLFSYAIKGLPFLKLSPSTKFLLRFKDIVRKTIEIFTNEKWFIATRRPLKEVMPSATLGKRSKVNRIVFLKQEVSGIVDIEKSGENFSKIANRIIDAGDINKVLKGQILAGKPQEIRLVNSLEKEVTRSLLKHVEHIHEIDPKRMTEQDWEVLEGILICDS